MFKKELIVAIMVLTIVFGAFPVNAATPGEAKVFEDVKVGYWAKNSID